VQYIGKFSYANEESTGEHNFEKFRCTEAIFAGHDSWQFSSTNADSSDTLIREVHAGMTPGSLVSLTSQFIKSNYEAQLQAVQLH
jgi:hypothetical protein